MSNVKFRAKKLRDNEWIIGDLWHCNYSDGRRTVTMCEQTPVAECNIEIHKETIGQYIGLKDIKEKEIYVGDLLKDEENFVWEVLPLGDGMFKISCDDLLAVESAYPRVVCCEVIGNIHDKLKL